MKIFSLAKKLEKKEKKPGRCCSKIVRGVSKADIFLGHLWRKNRYLEETHLRLLRNQFTSFYSPPFNTLNRIHRSITRCFPHINFTGKR